MLGPSLRRVPPPLRVLFAPTPAYTPLRTNLRLYDERKHIAITFVLQPYNSCEPRAYLCDLAQLPCDSLASVHGYLTAVLRLPCNYCGFLVLPLTLWSYHYGNLSFVTYSGVKATFSDKRPKCLGSHQIHIVSCSFKII